DGASRDRPKGRNRIGADGGQVLKLPVALEVDPLLPGLSEGEPEHLAKLRGEIGAATLPAASPLNHSFGTIRERKVRHESRSIQVRIDAYLKIDLCALRLQPDMVIERAAVRHHRAEDHLVVAAKGPALPARHPGFEKDRSEEHTSELQSRENLVCRLLLEKKNKHRDPVLYM